MIQTKPLPTIYLCIGGFNIRIGRTPRTRKVFSDEPILDINNLFRGFLIKKPKKIDHTIIIEKNPHPLILQREKKGKMNNLLYFYQEEGIQTRTFSHISEFQFKFIISGILLKLLRNNGGFILHASGVCVGNNATLFTGRSGGGKSTAVQLLKSEFTPIADDSLIIRKISKGNYSCYQIPFPEKNNIEQRKKKGYAISKILFLEKASCFDLVALRNKQSIWGKLSKQLFTETNYAGFFFKNLLNFTNTFKSFYRLSFFVDKVKMTTFFTTQIHTKQFPHRHQDQPRVDGPSAITHQESREIGYETRV